MKKKEIKKDLLSFVKGGNQLDGPDCNPRFYYADSIYVKPQEPLKPLKPLKPKK